MIGLELFRRKLVDRSGWDQSFVDGGSSTRGHDLARLAASGPEANGVAMRTTSTSRFTFKDPDVVDEFPLPVDTKTRSGSGTIRCATAADDGEIVRRQVTVVRSVNPFQDCRSLVQETRHDNRTPVTDKTTQDIRQHPVQEAVRDADESVTGPTSSGNDIIRTSDVTAWLDRIEQFETPLLLLNCSSSSSPSICDDSTGSRLLSDEDDRISVPPRHNPVAPRANPSSEAPLEPYSRAVSFLPSWDIDRLRTVYARLDASGFYLGRMSMDEARLRLAGYPVGTFLLRDSSDRRFLFSLSVQTRRGTTSIRILYEAGQFRLDSDQDQVHLMPSFECVLLLVGHYILPLAAVPRSVPNGSSSSSSYVFRETTGRRDTPVLLRRALVTTPSTLAHLCRRRIHRSIGRSPKGVGRLHLKPSLKSYLAEYPYDI